MDRVKVEERHRHLAERLAFLSSLDQSAHILAQFETETEARVRREVLEEAARLIRNQWRSNLQDLLDDISGTREELFLPEQLLSETRRDLRLWLDKLDGELARAHEQAAEGGY